MEEQPDLIDMPPDTSREDVDWKKFLLVTGKAGTGKMHCISKAIDEALNDERQILVATPTGFLATTYANSFLDDITADTVHSAFKYPVAPDENAQINWDLTRFDLIVLDEISMIPKRIANHIIETVNQLPTRPIVAMCGDRQQQQPIETTTDAMRPTISILQHRPFFSMVRHFKLTTQHRCEDPELESILNHLRYYRPSHKLLETLHENRVICSNNDPTNEQIASTLLQYPTATILTVTCAATNRINQIAVQTLYENKIPLCSVQCDCDLPPLPLYQDMAVVITQNRDKSNGVVNGQRASVYIVHRNTVFLKLPSGKIVNTYLVTRRKFDGSRKSTYPFVPA